MTKKPISPFSGTPRTTETIDKGGFPQYRIVSHELTPFGGKTADKLAFVSGIAAAGYAIIALLHQPHLPLSDFLIVPAAYVGAKCAVRLILRQELKVTTRFELDVAQIKVRNGLRTRRFDRRIEHRFLLLPHRFAYEEQLRNELLIRQAQLKGQAIRPPVYYGQSAYVALEYDGQIFNLCTIYGLPQAEALLRRLQLCSDRLNKAAKAGGSTKQDGTGDWAPAPGGLNDI